MDCAVEWCCERGLEFYAFPQDYPKEKLIDKGRTRKIKADLFFGDCNLGGLPDWSDIYRIIQEKITFEEFYNNKDEISQRKKSFGGEMIFLYKAMLKLRLKCRNT